MESYNNTFIGDEGIVLVDIRHMDEETVCCLNTCDTYCRTLEKKYGPFQVNDWIEQGVSHKTLQMYIANRTFLAMWGY